MVEPTELDGSRPRLRKLEARDPFLAATDAGAEIRRAVARALEAILPAGVHIKLSNIVIDNGKVNSQNIVVEVLRG